MAQTAEDVALIMNVIAGYDGNDSTSANNKIEDYTKNLNDSIKGLKIGLPQQYFDKNLILSLQTIIYHLAIFREVGCPVTFKFKLS